jgi:hypothetical protein
MIVQSMFVIVATPPHSFIIESTLKLSITHLSPNRSNRHVRAINFYLARSRPKSNVHALLVVIRRQVFISVCKIEMIHNGAFTLPMVQGGSAREGMG